MTQASKAGFNSQNYLDAFYMHQYVNCYPGNGGVTIGGVSGYQGKLNTVWHCAELCYNNPSCQCFVWQFHHTDAGEWSTSRNNCFLRQTCEINRCQRKDSNTYSKDFDTFIRKR
eukprot:Skav213128  [mRNA]  locus=scaffold107:208559:208900:+ [translate_table: standard]